MTETFTNAVDCATTNPGDYPQTLQVRAHTLHADVDSEAGSTDSAPSPHDYFDAALASCKALTATWYAKRHNIPLERSELSLEFIRVAAEAGAAVRSALADMRRAVPSARLIEMAHGAARRQIETTRELLLRDDPRYARRRPYAPEDVGISRLLPLSRGRKASTSSEHAPRQKKA